MRRAQVGRSTSSKSGMSASRSLAALPVDVEARPRGCRARSTSSRGQVVRGVGDDGDRRGMRGADPTTPAAPRWPDDPRHRRHRAGRLARRARAASSAATTCASPLRADSRARQPRRPRRTSASTRRRARPPRGAPGAARRRPRVPRGRAHVAARARGRALYRVNVEGTRIVLEECLRAGVERVVYTSSVAAIGPAPARLDRRRDARSSTPARYGIPYVDAKHEAEVEALRLAARGLPVVIVNPGARVRPRRPLPLVDRARAPLPAPPDPRLRRRRAERRRRPTTSPRGHLLADERGASGERYILGNRNYTLDRLFADLGRLSGVEPPALKLPLPAALAFAAAPRRLPGTAADHAGRGARRRAVVDVPQHEGQARAGLAPVAPRGHARGDGRLVPRARARAPRAPGHAPAVRAARRRARRAARPAASSAGSLRRPWPRSTAAAPRPTGCARAAASRARCARRASSHEKVRVAYAQARPRGGRGADRPAPRAACSCSTARRSATRVRIVEHLRWRAAGG